MMSFIPVSAAFLSVFGLIVLLFYCGREFDAEHQRVENYRR